MRVFVLTSGRAGSVTFARQLGERFPDARYVHLTRDEAATARSYERRWERTASRPRRVWRALRRPLDSVEGRLMPAFANGVIIQFTEWPDGERLAVARFMIESMISLSSGTGSARVDASTAPWPNGTRTTTRTDARGL